MKYVLFGSRYGAVSRLNELGANINTKNINCSLDRQVLVVYDSDADTYNGKNIKNLTVDDIINKHWYIDISTNQQKLEQEYYTIGDHLELLKECEIGVLSTYESDVARFAALVAVVLGKRIDTFIMRKKQWVFDGTSDTINRIFTSTTPILKMFHDENFRTIYRLYPIFKANSEYLNKFVDKFLDELDYVDNLSYDEFAKRLQINRWRSTVDGWHYKMLIQSIKYNGIFKLDDERISDLDNILNSNFIKNINKDSYNIGEGSYQNKTYKTIYENFNFSINTADYILGNENIELPEELTQYFIDGFDESVQIFNKKFKNLSGLNVFLMSMKYNVFSGVYSSNITSKTIKFLKENYPGLKTMNENIAKILNKNATSKQCSSIAEVMKNIMADLFDWNLLNELTLNMCFPHGAKIGGFEYAPKKENKYSFILNSVKSNPLGIQGYLATLLTINDDELEMIENDIAESLFKLISHDCTRYYGDWEFSSIYRNSIKDRISDTKREFILKAAFKYIESTNKTLLYRKYIAFVKNIGEDSNLPAEVLKNKVIRKIIMEADLKE